MTKVWVVGGTSGIGQACAAKIRRRYGTAVYSTGTDADVRHLDDLERFHNERKPFTHIVYSAGWNYLQWAGSNDFDYYAAMNILDVNILGLLRVIQLVQKDIVSCVVIGSDAATRPMRTSAVYNASKAGLNAAVKCIARENAGKFTINIVSPGLVAGTAMTEYVYRRTDELRPGLDLHRYMQDQIPIGRMATTTEIAAVVDRVLFMNEPYMTGAIIEVNGGR